MSTVTHCLTSVGISVGCVSSSTPGSCAKVDPTNVPTAGGGASKDNLLDCCFGIKGGSDWDTCR